MTPTALQKSPMSVIEDPDAFSPGALRSAAERKAGSSDYGSDSYMVALTPLLYSIEHEAELNAAGRQEVWQRIVDALANRLTVVAWEKANPELAAAVVLPPLVILGLQRTGSSILHETLAAAPGLRTPLIWEVRDYTLAHSVTDPRSDPRVQKIAASIARKNEQVPGYAAIHFEDAFVPMECLALTILDLVSTQFSTIAWAPTYRKFLLSHDARGVYQWHKRALRYLQANSPETRWVLKAPMHSLYIDALLQTYPDAMVIQTHRNPMSVIGSLFSLYATLRRAWSDHVPIENQSESDATYPALAMQRAVSYRRDHPESAARFHDVAFKDFLADPAATLTGIYDYFGLPLTGEALDMMLTHLRNRPREKYGRHDYSLAQFGLTTDEVAPLFADYTEQYGKFF